MDAQLEDADPVVEMLASRYPHVPRNRIETVVENHWRSYSEASVRSFIPVLVSREASAELRRS